MISRFRIWRMRARRRAETLLAKGWVSASTARTLTRWSQGRREYARRCNSDVEHAFHVWINRRQDARRKLGETWERDLYEFKDMLGELRRLPVLFRRERLGLLPTVHQQCSHSAPETITDNRLVCALGIATAECPILLDLAGEFAEQQRNRLARFQSTTLQPEHLDELKARVCCWHIYTSAMRDPDLDHVDTSEGYILDEGDRRFWSTVYESMAAGMDDDLTPHDAAPGETETEESDARTD